MKLVSNNSQILAVIYLFFLLKVTELGHLFVMFLKISVIIRVALVPVFEN